VSPDQFGERPCGEVPIGAKPRSNDVHADHSRALSSSPGSEDVLMEARGETSPAPKTARNASDNQRVRRARIRSERRRHHVVEATNPAEPAHRTARSKRQRCLRMAPSRPRR